MQKIKGLSSPSYVWLRNNIKPYGFATEQSAHYKAPNDKRLLEIIRDITRLDSPKALEVLLQVGYTDEIHTSAGLLGNLIFFHKALECFKFILTSEYRVNTKHLLTPDLLVMAVKTNELKFVQALVEQDYVSYRRSFVLQSGVGAIHMALAQGNLDMFEYFFQKNLPIPFFTKTQPSGNNNLFTIASWQSNEETKKKILHIMLEYLNIHNAPTLKQMFAAYQEDLLSPDLPTEYSAQFENLDIVLEQKLLTQRFSQCDQTANLAQSPEAKNLLSSLEVESVSGIKKSTFKI